MGFSIITTIRKYFSFLIKINALIFKKKTFNNLSNNNNYKNLNKPKDRKFKKMVYSTFTEIFLCHNINFVQEKCINTFFSKAVF